VLVKDAFETAEMPTSFGSAAFKGYQSGRDATVIARLRRAGALIIAKSTLGEFASGYAGSISGPARNPYDLTRHPSGSSSGTGAGLAADFATVAIGGDTGGSIRGPAAVGSLVGHRPTLPLVSRHGSVPFKPSYDSVGPLTRTVKDAALVMDAIAGYDPNDRVTAYAVGRLPSSLATGLSRNALKGARLGVVRQPMQRETDTAAPDHRAIRTVFETAIGELRRAGATLVDDVRIPDVADRTRAAYEANIFETEAALNAYFAELPNAPVTSLRALLASPGGLLPWRSRALTPTLGRTQDEAAYLQVLRGIEDTRRLVLALMADRQLDALVCPSADHYPARLAPDIMTNPAIVGDTRLGSNRTLAAVLAWPAVTVPAGLTGDGMPVGLEFAARAFDDGRVLGYAYAYEQATHHRRPPASTPPLTDARTRP
jgi:Asp-tRNA(Asn)/Glu-tRNA(Gln) amidotransferase A subunit family amidase